MANLHKKRAVSSLLFRFHRQYQIMNPFISPLIDYITVLRNEETLKLKAFNAITSEKCRVSIVQILVL